MTYELFFPSDWHIYTCKSYLSGKPWSDLRLCDRRYVCRIIIGGIRARLQIEWVGGNMDWIGCVEKDRFCSLVELFGELSGGPVEKPVKRG